MNYRILTFTFLISLILAACSWDTDEQEPDYPDILPGETQTGENRLGCLINGEVFVNTKFRANHMFAPPVVSAIYFRPIILMMNILTTGWKLQHMASTTIA